MMLTYAEYIEPNPIGGLHFRQKFLHPIDGRQRPAGLRVRDSRRETVDSDFDRHGSERDTVASLEGEDFSCFVRGCD